MKIIAVITARSGSKSIPHKNIRELGGKPLLCWGINALSRSKSVEKIVLSTDSDEYYRIGKSFYDKIIFHKRTPELAEDVPSELVLFDAIKKMNDLFDDDSIIVMIQPTTPFIKSKHIDECVSMLIKRPEINSCISVRKISEHPEWMIIKKDDKDNIGVCNDVSGDLNVRQNLQKRWISNGGIWAVKRKFLEKSRKIVDNEKVLLYEMPRLNGIDIDEEEDFIICEALVKSGIMQMEKQ
jgi:CMP-N-acetylneuraminic acid synthetase